MVSTIAFLGSLLGWIAYHWLAIALGLGAAFAVSFTFKYEESQIRKRNILVASIFILSIPIIYFGSSSLYDSIFLSQMDNQGSDVAQARMFTKTFITLWGIILPAFITMLFAAIAWLFPKKINRLIFPSAALILSAYFVLRTVPLASHSDDVDSKINSSQKNEVGSLDNVQARLTETDIHEISRQKNKDLPTMVDSLTELVSTSGGPGMRLNYYFRIVPTNLGPDDFTEDVVQRIKSNTISQSCKNLSLGLKSGIVYSFQYRDARESNLFNFTITPIDCIDQ